MEDCNGTIHTIAAIMPEFHTEIENARILIVEDEPVSARMLSSRLEAMGAKIVAIIDSGEEAIARALLEKPDLIFMDIMLAGEMDGVQAAEAIQTKISVPVVYLTAYSDDKILNRAQITDAFGYIIKPFDVRELKVITQIALHKHQIELRLKRQEQVLASTLDNLTDAVFTFKADGSILYANRAARIICGLKQGEEGGLSWQHVLHFAPGFEHQYTEVKRAFEEPGQDQITIEARLITADASEVIVEIKIADWEGRPGEVGKLLGLRDITNRRHAEERVRLLAAAMYSAQEGVLIFRQTNDAKQVIEYVNPAYCDLIGEELDQITDQQPSLFNELPDEESLSALTKKIKEYGTLNGESEIQNRKTDRHITLAWNMAAVASDPTNDKYLIVMRDITLDRQNTDRLTRRFIYEAGISAFTRALLDSAQNVLEDALSQLVIYFNLSRVFIFQLQDSSDLKLEIHVDRKDDNLLNAVDSVKNLEQNYQKLMAGQLDRLLQGRPLIKTIQDHYNTDETVSTRGRLIVLPIQPANRLSAILCMEDFTQKREWNQEDLHLLMPAADTIGMYMERQEILHELREHRDHLEIKIQEQTDGLRKALNVAESATRAKSEFLANMSHELRTPLNSIIGFSRLIKLEDGNPQKEMLGYINSAGKHLLRIINDILDLSKLEAGQMVLNLQKLNLQDMLQNSASLLMPEAQRKQIPLNFQINHSKNLNIYGDDKRIQQVFLNVLSNAVKFTPEHGAITICSSILDNVAIVEIIDNGPGIPVDKLEHIFENFAQTNASMDSAHEGAGLGLAISRQIMNAHKGQIYARQNPEGGSIFYVEIPLAESILEKNEDEREPIESENIDRSKYLIVAVDDDSRNLTLIRMLLQDAGFAVETFSNTEVCLDYCRHNNVDIVLTDLRLPGKDGYWLLSELRKWKPGLPVVTVTAVAVEGSREEILEAGFDGYLSKPIVEQELMNMLDRILSIALTKTRSDTND